MMCRVTADYRESRVSAKIHCFLNLASAIFSGSINEKKLKELEVGESNDLMIMGWSWIGTTL